MAITPIAPQRVVQKKSGRKGGGGLGQIIGGVAGAALGTMAAPGVGTKAGATAGALAGGALSGAATGAGLGGMIGGGISPGRAPAATETLKPQVQLTAMQEAQRGQQLLEGLRVANNSQNFQSYAEPLTQAFIQSRANLHKMG
jgi:hypothetical protein